MYHLEFLDAVRIPPSLRSESKYNKLYACPFCETLLQKLPRHLFTQHPNESEVQKVRESPKGSSQRLDLLKTLEKKGNFILKIVLESFHYAYIRQMEISNSVLVNRICR